MVSFQKFDPAKGGAKKGKRVSRAGSDDWGRSQTKTHKSRCGFVEDSQINVLPSYISMRRSLILRNADSLETQLCEKRKVDPVPKSDRNGHQSGSSKKVKATLSSKTHGSGFSER